jgi:gamma-glutamyltranspeptidase / glutathione hydrolase
MTEPHTNSWATRLLLVTLAASTLAYGSGPALAQQEEGGAPPANNGGDLVGYDSIHHPTLGREGMVVSQSDLASEIGARILKAGGNAVDAAVAVAVAETMTLPRAGNLGGGGYMLVYNAADKSTTAIEYYGQAPIATTPDLLLGDNGKFDTKKGMSFKGVAVPGTVAGLYEAHRRFGKLPWARLLQPAIDLAEKGVVLSNDEAEALAARHKQMAKDPDGAARVFFKPDGSAYRAGEVFRDPDLAWTLRQIQAHGADGFYRGEVARRLIAGVRKGGGVLSEADLAGYKVNVSPPVWSTYRGYRIAFMPPTSAGSNVAEAMNILEQFPVKSLGQGNVATMHLIAETLKVVAADRRYSAPGTAGSPYGQALLSKAFAAQRAKLISPDKSLHRQDLPSADAVPYESPNTTQFSIVDAAGDAVSNTFTLSSSFGAHVVAPGTGFLLNNSMGNFSWGGRTHEHDNDPAPGKRARSTISPLIVYRDDRPWVVTGSPGGGTIIATMVQMLVNVIDFDLNIAEATERPRIYQAGVDGPLELENGVPGDLAHGLEAKGHKVERSEIIGSTQSIMIGPDGRLYGAADTRRPGSGVAKPDGEASD